MLTMFAIAVFSFRLPRMFLRSLSSTGAGSDHLLPTPGPEGGAPSPEPGDNPYRRAMYMKTEQLRARLNDPARFVSIAEREERSVFPFELAQAIINGKFLSFYRGIDLLKGPEDLFILYQMFWHVRPRTVIELGSFTGASALWMADALKGSNIECNVFSVDIDLSLLHPLLKSLQPPNLSFFEGDCNEIKEVFPTRFLNEQPHPIIIIDDAHIDIPRTMDYFHRHLLPGDYIVCEDTSPGQPAVPLSSDDYSALGLDKLHAWKQFLTKYGDMYAVDTFFTDYFGYNASSNWNGYAKRMK